jgi:hypothetical protein
MREAYKQDGLNIVQSFKEMYRRFIINVHRPSTDLQVYDVSIHRVTFASRMR